MEAVGTPAQGREAPRVTAENYGMFILGCSVSVQMPGRPAYYCASSVTERGNRVPGSPAKTIQPPSGSTGRPVIFRSHGLLQIIQGTLRFPCAGCRQLPFCVLAIWGHLALQAVPSRQVS